ncbi:MAG: ABC transporter ATP-binding protein [Acidimicrobiales bacterium]
MSEAASSSADRAWARRVEGGPAADAVAPRGDVVLSVEDLHVEYRSRGVVMRVLPGVDLEVRRGEVLGVVGESGSGKSTLALSVLRLLPPNGRIVGGRVLLEGTTDLASLGHERLRRVRGEKIGMVFQDPLTSLNPTFRIGTQMVEVQAAHGPRRPGRAERSAYRQKAVSLLRLVGLPDPERVMRAYPHQLSGGMRQRVVIAMALSLDPELLIADEPTSALDVTTEAQIIALLQRIRTERELTVLFVTHDLSVVGELCDRVAVMYAGQVVEHGRAADVFDTPQHPYTEALLRAVPARSRRGEPLASIPGQVPSLLGELHGCRFASRCSYVQDLCHRVDPKPLPSGASELVRCLMRDPGSGYDHPAADAVPSAP